MKKGVKENLIIIGVSLLIVAIVYAFKMMMPCSHIGCKH